MTMHRHTMRTRRGFTILELLIVVTMVALLSAMSLGRTSKIMSGWRVNRAAQTTSEELQKAFALVGRNRKVVVIHFDPATAMLSMRNRSGTTTFSRRSFGKDSEYKFSGSEMTFTNNALEVFPPGLAAGELTVTISKDGITKRVRMLRGGLVMICKSQNTTTC